MKFLWNTISVNIISCMYYVTRSKRDRVYKLIYRIEDDLNFILYDLFLQSIILHRYEFNHLTQNQKIGVLCEV